jgi:hypothetical protein
VTTRICEVSPEGTVELNPGLRSISANLFWDVLLQNCHKNVILRACDFFNLLVFPAYSTSCIQALRQSRHPERSASQIYRVTQRFWRGVEGPRRCFTYPCCSELSPTGAASVFPWGRERKEVPLTFKCVSQQNSVVGCRWLKSSQQHGSIKRPRGPSTPRHKGCVAR